MPKKNDDSLRVYNRKTRKRDIEEEARIVTNNIVSEIKEDVYKTEKALQRDAASSEKKDPRNARQARQSAGIVKAKKARKTSGKMNIYRDD